MTEQLEDDFWATERARDTAARGRQADPGACGTCKASVEAGGQVKHDECAQRATLLPAPDAPAWELITGLSEEELAELPARFHVPAFVESSTPKAWVCAVCWGDGWSTQWPCKTATEQGLRVFTDEHQAETAAKRQTVQLATAQAELAEAQARIAELEGQLAAEKDRFKAGLRRADERVNAMSEELKRYADGKETPVLWSVYNAMHLRAATAEARVAELEAERAKYVGVEPTIAEEMAYLSSCLDAVHQVCDAAVRQATRWENPLPVPEWVETVRQAADGVTEAVATRPALPWAQLMDADDLAEFLAELEHAIATPGATPDEVLAAVEKACADWRTPGQGPRGDEPGTGEGR